MTGFFQVTSACTQPEVQRTTTQPSCCLLSLQPTSSIQLQGTYPRMMLQYWRCESLSRSWGNPEGYQLLLLILAVGNFKRWVCTMDFSTSFHQLGFFLSISPSSSTFIKREQEYLSASLKKIRFIWALFPCLRFYSPPCERIPTGVTMSWAHMAL